MPSSAKIGRTRWSTGWLPRPAHVERLQALQNEGRLLLAGPFPAIDSPDPGPAGFSGSLIVAEFASLTAARAWASADPYVAAGVYARRSASSRSRKCCRRERANAAAADVATLIARAPRGPVAEPPGTDRRIGAARRPRRRRGRWRTLSLLIVAAVFSGQPRLASPPGARRAWRSDARPDSRAEHPGAGPRRRLHRRLRLLPDPGGRLSTVFADDEAHHRFPPCPLFDRRRRDASPLSA
jgi:uncharacterized protein YciI